MMQTIHLPHIRIAHVAALAKGILLTAMVFSAVMADAQSEDFFKPYRTTNLRLPAVPLITSDPYFSIWSAHDKLYEGYTTHWTGDAKPIDGYLRVDGKAYRFMGREHPVLEAVVPMADQQPWQGMSTTEKPATGWQEPGFDDSSWKKQEAAFGTSDMHDVHTPWKKEHSDIYVRRTFNLDEQALASDLYFIYSHDDAAEFYINGKLAARGAMDLVEGERLHLTGEMKKLLHKGTNVIAAHCYNNTGGAYLDFGIYRDISRRDYNIEQALQTDVSVTATSSYYTFTCGKVKLQVVFTAPFLLDDYDLLSCPINYISYRVQSLDRKAHDIQLMLTTTPQLAVNKTSEATRSEWVSTAKGRFLRTGTVNQPILASKGDNICIDWGYLYLPEVNGDLSLTDGNNAIDTFCTTGVLPQTQQKVHSTNEADMPALCYRHDFGKTKQAESFWMMGYDEVQDIEYMYHRYQAYWAHEGKVTLDQMFSRLQKDYTTIMNRCRQLDRQIYDDGLASGGVKYAEMLSGSYRQVIAAHKLFRDNDGNLLFFSKENDSGGCVNTVDVTYPSTPLFLVYRPELAKAMLTSILDYSRSERWTKPFAAHDLGFYPIADAQAYGADMPLEEAGNMLILCAELSHIDGNVNYASPYWDILTTWVNYLVENGQDPANQLCTDDFAGHWAHNCNLTIKAIMGIAGYAIMAKMRGDTETADRYMQKARQMAVKWESDAREGDHYRLAFDRPNTWSQKYNMVWDKLWHLNLFPNGAMQREIDYYLTKQNKYGLPLDCRKDYTKSDWIMWTATMAPDEQTFARFMDPVYQFINETESRVPLSDWHDSVTGLKCSFIGRSVIGGYWMKVLYDKENEHKQ